MSSEMDGILQFNQNIKLDKDFHDHNESLIKKIYRQVNNPENSLTTKIGHYIPCRYSRSTIWEFDYIEGKHTLYSGKNCMKTFYSFLREKKMLPLTKEQLKSHQNGKVRETVAIRQVNVEAQNIVFVI